MIGHGSTGYCILCYSLLIGYVAKYTNLRLPLRFSSFVHNEINWLMPQAMYGCSSSYYYHSVRSIHCSIVYDLSSKGNIPLHMQSIIKLLVITYVYHVVSGIVGVRLLVKPYAFTRHELNCTPHTMNKISCIITL